VWETPPRLNGDSPGKKKEDRSFRTEKGLELTFQIKLKKREKERGKKPRT